MNIQISDHFNYRKLIQFVMPSIGMMLVLSIYGVVDGFFVSNFVGKTAFAAVNFIWPVLMLISAVGIVFGTGGNALISKVMGEGDDKRANSIFSLLVYTAFAIGIVFTILFYIALPAIASFLGAEGQMYEDCILYGRIFILSMPAYILQNAFQSFFVTAEKPQLGFAVTVGAGITNVVLDALFVALFKWGLVGAAIATAASQVVGGILPLFYFFRKNSSKLRLGKTVFQWFPLVRTCTNGVSEFVTNISMSFISILYNVQLMKYVGEDGVAAYGVIMYVNFIFISIYLGYSIGTAPLFGYNYGAQNHKELKNLLYKSIKIISIFSVIVFVAIELLAKPFSMLFIGYDKELLDITIYAFRIFSLSFLFAGINIFGSGFFTALNNGLVSAVIAFVRTMILEVAAVLILPIFFGVTGIWSSVVVAEICAMLITLILIYKLKNKYHY